MFTIKYRVWQLTPNQSSDGPATYYSHEQLHGPFELISQEHAETGEVVVHAHREGGAPGVMFGPWLPSTPEAAGDRAWRPTLWVMNEQGQTVAKYDL